MVKFTRNMDELLIDLLKGHKILFDPGDENFKNNILKHKSWEEISAIVAVPVPECKKRWKSLRDQYNKKKKGDLSCNSNWDYMNLMSFLSDATERRDDITSCGDRMHRMANEPIEEQDTDYEPQHEELQEEKNQQPTMNENSQDSSLNTEDIVVSRNRRRILKRSSLEPYAKIMAKRRQRVIYEKMKNVPEIKTPTQKFFEAMTDIVNKLPNDLQAEVRLKVCQIVTEAEIKHHTQHTQCPNRLSQSYNQFSDTVQTSGMSRRQQASNTQVPVRKFKMDLD